MRAKKTFKEKHITLHDFKEIIKIQRSHLKELIKRESDIQSDIFKATKFILEENVDLYKSIVLLYKRGYIQSCLLLARSIIENVINLQYIFQEDTEKRAKNYTFHSTAINLEKIKKIEKKPPGTDEVIKYFEKIKNEIQKSGNQKNYWDGISFKKICEELDQAEIYEQFYSRLSEYTHSQYKGIRSLEIERPYTDFIKKFLTKNLQILTLQSLKSINEKYNLYEGGAIITDYPKRGAVTVFSISSKETDEKTAEQLKKFPPIESKPK